MLQIIIPESELWDENKQEFIRMKKQELRLEHSLVSLSKWESKWHKAFLSNRTKTREETLDYIKCMTLTQNVNPEVYKCLTNENFKQIEEYIRNPMTATYLPKDKSVKNSRDVVTSELIYYWMISLNIPPEYQKWHLNKLISLIDVCNRKNNPSRRRNNRDIMSDNAALNAARRKRWNTKG